MSGRPGPPGRGSVRRPALPACAVAGWADAGV